MSFVICFSIFITDILVLEFSNNSFIDLIECSESQKEEVEETDVDDFLRFSNMSANNYKLNNIQSNSLDMKLFRLFIDVFTPPPEMQIS